MKLAKLLAFLSLAVTCAVGCAVQGESDPVPPTSAESTADDAPARNEAIPAVDDNSLKPMATCPPAAMCRKAYGLCPDPVRQTGTYCNIARRCSDCALY